MRKLLKSMKTLLIAAGLLVGTSAWAGTSTWTYSTTSGENTFGTAFQGSTSGLVNVTLGTAEQASHWQINKVGNNNTMFGLNNETDQKTYDATNTNVPTGGTFMAVTPVVDVNFSVTWRSFDNVYVYLVNGETNAKTQLVRAKNTQTTNCGKLTAGTTYYIYADSEEREFSFQGFTATAYENYTINYTYGESTIKSESSSALPEAEVNASYSNFWDDGSTQKYYVADNATTSFTIEEDGQNTFEVALRLAAADAVASVNAVDNNGTVLATFNGPTGTEGEAYDGYVYYTRAVLYDGKYYAVAAANGNSDNYGKNNLVYGTPGEVTYTLDETITYYTEVENNLVKSRDDALINRTGNWAPNRASGCAWYTLYSSANVYTPSGTLPAGVYKLEVSARNGSGKNSGSIDIKVRDSKGTYGDVIGTLEWGITENAVKTLNYILVPEGASVALCNPNNSNSNICLDYIILCKLYDVTDASKVIGAVDYSTAYGSSIGGAIHKDLSVSKGEKMKINFQNHGSAANNYNNWALRIVNNTANFDRTLACASHIVGTDAYENVNRLFEMDGSVVSYDDFMADYKTQMKDANVDLTITYTTDGMFSVIEEAKGADHTYKFTMNYDIAFTDDVTMELGVDCAWLEVLSESIVAEITAAAGAATFVSNHALDFTNVEDLQAYIATEQNGASITFDQVTGAVPANTPLLLRGTTANIPVAASAEEVGNNLLVAGTGAAVASEDNGKYNFILNKIDDVVGFYKAASQTVASNRAYLSLSDNPFPGGGAKSVTMIFNGETTGITTVAAPASKAVVKGTYNMQGQRVQNPSKGLYIVDGKKVAIN